MANPKAQKYLQNAMALYKSGDLQQAASELKNAIKIDPAYEDAYFNLGVIGLSMKKFEGGFKYFKKLIAINPNYKKNWDDVIYQLIVFEQYEFALTVLKKGLEKFPDESNFWVNLSVVLRKLGRLTEALKIAIFAIDSSGALEKGVVNLAETLKEMGKLEDAILAVNNYLRISKGRGDSAKLKLEGYLKLAEEKGLDTSSLLTKEIKRYGIDDFKLAESIEYALDYGKNYIGYNNLGLAYKHLDMIDEACSAFREGLQHYPGKDVLLQNLMNTEPR